jgi:hypothetical protein
MTEVLPPTAFIRNSGFTAKTKVIVFNKSQCQSESEVLFNPLLLIHAKRWRVIEKKFEILKKNKDLKSPHSSL